MIIHPQRGPGRGSYIGGRSVHNQRIERHWKDVYYGITSMYYDLFGYLEEKLLLDVNNPSHMWALQFVYSPRINKALQILRMVGVHIQYHLNIIKVQSNFEFREWTKILTKVL